VPAKTFNEEWYKIWTLDCGLDHRLNNGFNSGQNSEFPGPDVNMQCKGLM